jgi:hypothetical protein
MEFIAVNGGVPIHGNRYGTCPGSENAPAPDPEPTDNSESDETLERF